MPQEYPKPSKPASVHLASSKDLFTITLEAYRAALAEDRGHARMTASQREYVLHLREARLLSLISPQEVEDIAIGIARDTSKDSIDRLFSIELLKYLSIQGRGNSERVLYNLAFDQDKSISAKALGALYEVDDKGAYRDLYWTKSRQGDELALSMIATWPDPQAKRVCEEVIGKNPGNLSPAYEIRRLAEQGLEQMAVLSSENWPEKLEGILLGSDSEKSIRWFDWALKVAKIRSLPNLGEICRKRISAGQAKLFEYERTASVKGVVNPGYAQTQFRNAPQLIETEDKRFDDLLIVYFKLGGALSGIERERLQLFGYACDPKVRLAEILLTQSDDQ